MGFLRVKIILGAIFVLLVAAILIRHFRQRSESPSANPISLLDQLHSDNVLQTKLKPPIQVIHQAPLKNRWRKLVTFPSASIWVTFIDNYIANNQMQLYKNGAPVKIAGDLFQSGIQANNCNFFQNQIFLSVENGSDPNDAKFFIDYEMYPGLVRQRIRNEVAQNIFPFEATGGIFRLEHPLLLENPDSPDAALQKNGKALPFSGWRYAFAPDVLLFQSSALVTFRMFGSKDVLGKDLYAQSGLLQVTITAAGELAGTEFPRLGIHLDGKKIGTVSIKKAEYTEYSFITPVSDGHHHFEVIFENDFMNPITGEDRNVNVKQVQLRYLPAVILKEFTTDARYTIDYWTSDFDSKNYYSQFVRERERNNEWINRVTTAVPIHDELRRSMVLGSGDQMKFSLSVPHSAVLEFGFGSRSARPQKHGRLIVKIERTFRRKNILFSQQLEETNTWRDVALDLAAYSGQRIRLLFENAPTDAKSNHPTLVFISNPRVSYDHTDRADQGSPKLILLFSFDALRADHLGAYGYERPTSPNIDSFANSAVLFENVYTSETWTLSSFASLFSSIPPSFHNVRDINQSLNRNIVTFTQLLQRSGFSTAAFVSNPLLHPLYGFARGFDLYNFQQGTVDERVESVLNWLRSPPPQKTFLFIHLMNPHSPYTAPERILHRLGNTEAKSALKAAYINLSNRKGCSDLAEKDLRDVVLQYDAEILQGDELFQKIVERLKKMQLFDDAMIILMSDHGEEFMDHRDLWHGSNAFYATAKVPLIIKFPKKYNVKAKRISERIQLLDVMPTILQLARIPIPAQAQGRSLLPLLQSASVRGLDDRNLFTENRKGIVAIVHDRYRYFYGDPKVLSYSCEPHRSEELYDLETDPLEKHDVSFLHPDIMKSFQLRLSDYSTHAKAFRERTSSALVEPNESMKEELHALGYIH